MAANTDILDIIGVFFFDVDFRFFFFKHRISLPCGTPDVTGDQLESVPLTTTHCSSG